MAHRNRRRQRPSRDGNRGQAVIFLLPSPLPQKISRDHRDATMSDRLARHDRPLRQRPEGHSLGGIVMGFLRAALSVVFAMTSFAAVAADYPTPKQGDWIAKDFKFHTGETMEELKLHSTTR